jgi:hypothetical protein
MVDAFRINKVGGFARVLVVNPLCRAPLQMGCPKHHGHKGDPGVTPRTCGADGKKAQVIQVWVRAPNVGNASHPQGLGILMERLMA